MTSSVTASSQPTPVRRWLAPHAIGVLLTALVFPLIWLGGLVTTYDAGMAVPDWPGTFGYNMFAYPLSTWFFGPWDLFVEHGHRLLASVSGVVAIALVWSTYRFESRRWVRRFSVLLLAMIIGQGMLGGFRVTLDDRTFARIHGCIGPLFFAGVVGFCVVTSRWWFAQAAIRAGETLRRRRLFDWPIVMLIACYVQLVIGACFRHIAIDATPRLFGALVATHVLLAVGLVVGTFFHGITLTLARRAGVTTGRGINASGLVVIVLILIQFSLGLGAWVVKWGWPIWFADTPFAASFVIGEKEFWQMNLVTAHAAIGSLLLAFWTVHAVRCQRVFSPSWFGSRRESPVAAGHAMPAN